MAKIPVYDEEHGVDAYFRQKMAETDVTESGGDASPEYGDLLANAELLKDDDDLMSQFELPEDNGEEFTTANPKGTKDGRKFNLRVKATKAKPAGKRGRPTRAEALEKARAKALAEGRPFDPLLFAAKPRQPLSAKAKAKKKAKASASGKEHRERRNAAVDAMRKVLPGATPKLDTGNTLELGLDFILFTRKRTGINIDEINAEFLATLKVKQD